MPTTAQTIAARIAAAQAEKARAAVTIRGLEDITGAAHELCESEVEVPALRVEECARCEIQVHRALTAASLHQLEDCTIQFHPTARCASSIEVNACARVQLEVHTSRTGSVLLEQSTRIDVTVPQRNATGEPFHVVVTQCGPGSVTFTSAQAAAPGGDGGPDTWALPATRGFEHARDSNVPIRARVWWNELHDSPMWALVDNFGMIPAGQPTHACERVLPDAPAA